MRRGFLASLGRAMTWGAVQHWRHGRRRMPSWAALVLAEQLEERARVASELATGLRAHAEKMDALPVPVHGRLYARKPPE